jgi:hypothetical protein
LKRARPEISKETELRKPAGWSPATAGFRRSAAALFTGLGLVVMVLAVGCSSDETSLVGTGLVDAGIDNELETMLAVDIIQYGARDLIDPDVPLDDQELLYLGSQAGNSSAILVNFDFSNVYTDSFPDTMFTTDKIKFVRFQMFQPTFYKKPGPDDGKDGEALKASDKALVLHALDAPFDSLAFPGEIPPYDDDINYNTDPDELYNGLVSFPINEVEFLNWVQSQEMRGFVLLEGLGSEDGLVGFGSRDNKHVASQFDDQAVGTTLGCVLLVEFEETDERISIPSAADISTFHELAQPPADPAEGFMVRGCLRNVPIMRFSLDGLPENVAINRAVLQVVNDTTTSFGNLESLVVSEFNMDFFGAEGDTLDLEELDLATFTIAGMTSLDPLNNDVMQFNVTQAIQRIVNGVYDGERAFIMTMGEDQFSRYDLSTVDPDFYFTQFNFFGSAAADSLRPQLRITYSGVDELIGGGQ